MAHHVSENCLDCVLDARSIGFDSIA